MSTDLCEALKEKKVDAAVKEIDDRNHITIMLNLMLREADPTTQAMLEFVAEHVGLKLKPRDAKNEK